MTVAELKKLLTERNIKGRSHITKKSEMIDVLIKFDTSEDGKEDGNEDDDEDYIFEENFDLDEYNEEDDGEEDWEITKEEYEGLMEESKLSLDDVMERYK